MKHQVYFLFRTAVLIFMSAILWGCESLPEIPDDAISIGVMLPFTGKDAAIGANYEHALLMVENEVNASGGINGRPVAFLVRDTHSSPDGALTALGDLLERKVVAIIGPEDTEIVRELLPTLEAEGIPLVSPVISGGNSIELPDDYRWFRLAPSASILGRSFANRLWRDGIDNLTIVYSPGDYHMDFVGSLTERYTVLGGNVSGRVYLEDNPLSYARQVNELRGGARQVVLSAPVASAARLINDLSTTVSSEKCHYYLSPVLETPFLPQNTVPDALNGALGIGVRASGFDVAFFDKYVDKWTTEPLDGAYFYYDAAALVVLALAQALHLNDTCTTDAFNQAIESVAYRQGIQVKWNQVSSGLQYAAQGTEISYSGLSGPLLFDASGQQQKAAVKYWTVQDGTVIDDAL